MGAAILAALGVGAHADVRAAIESMTSIDRRFAPDPKRMGVYDGVFEAYVDLYPALAGVLESPAGSARTKPDGVAA
jgi:ribulose kinase